MIVPEPLCGHGAAGIVFARGRARCGSCGSYWDMRALRQPFQYDADYPGDRGHLDEEVGRCKAASFVRWLELLDLDLTGKTVFEVGYGGGWCLAVARRRARRAYGMEVVAENAVHARALGLPPLDLFTPDSLPGLLSEPVDLWMYLDAFEHLADPVGHLAWVRANSAPGAQLLLVLPQAGSLSDRLLGRAWPHRLPDHAFHWSAPGLTDLLSKSGFGDVRRFNPTKQLSARMLLTHALHQAGLSASPPAILDRFRVWWNVGELGIFARSA